MGEGIRGGDRTTTARRQRARACAPLSRCAARCACRESCSARQESAARNTASRQRMPDNHHSLVHATNALAGMADGHTLHLVRGKPQAGAQGCADGDVCVCATASHALTAGSSHHRLSIPLVSPNSLPARSPQHTHSSGRPRRRQRRPARRPRPPALAQPPLAPAPVPPPPQAAPTRCFRRWPATRWCRPS